MPDDELRKPLLQDEANKLLEQIDESGWMDSHEVMYVCACMIARQLTHADPVQVTHFVMCVDQWIAEELHAIASLTD
jgi:hypothetical protein